MRTLFIDPEIPYLGASTDGTIAEDGIVEIKCPFAAKNMTPEDAIENNVSQLRSLYITKDDSHTKRAHKYYYQIQGQLHVTRRSYCIFVVWTPRGMKTEVIHRDDQFWAENMENQLTRFYLHCMLPEIVDPRFIRNMAIRDPDYIIEAQKRK